VSGDGITVYDFTYTASLSGGKALPVFVQLDSSTLTFSVSTSDTSKIGKYSIVIVGTLNDHSNSSGSFEFALNIVSATNVIV